MPCSRDTANPPAPTTTSTTSGIHSLLRTQKIETPSVCSPLGRNLPSSAPARREKKPICCGSRGSRALASLEDRCRSVTLTGVTDRAGVHDSAVRRYFSSHEGGAPASRSRRLDAGSNTVCAAFREPGPMSPSQVVETLANGLADDPPICDLLADLHLHLEHEVDLDGLSRSGGPAPLPKFRSRKRSSTRCRCWGLGRTKRPSRGPLIDRLLLVDRPPAAEADRRLRRGAAGPG